jgi:hypothetical protein
MALSGHFKVFFAIFLAHLVLFAALFWATNQYEFLRKPFAISSYAVNKSSKQHPSNSSKLVDDVISLWTTALNIPLSPATLFDSELGDLAQRLLDPPVPAPARPLHIMRVFDGFKMEFGDIPASKRVLVDSGCAVPPNACAFSENHDYRSLSTADVLLWHNAVPSDTILSISSFKRPRQQIWAFAQFESPLLGGWFLEVFDDRQGVNWTISYRLDSTLPDPYERYVSRRQLERLLEEVGRWPSEYRTPLVIRRINQIRNHLNNNIKLNNMTSRTFGKPKDKKVAWFVSNKHAKNKRWEYALELSKHIQVDIYSPNGPFNCSKQQSSDCFYLLNKHYKFYLSFENSNCRHYITEKLFVNALR